MQKVRHNFAAIARTSPYHLPQMRPGESPQLATCSLSPMPMSTFHPNCRRWRLRYVHNMWRLTLILFFGLLTSCTTLNSAPGTSNYSKLEGYVGHEITLVGYWSAQHEATGIYFYHDAPKRCVIAEPALLVEHGSTVRVKGVLARSGCGDELICLTVCQPYVLKNAEIID